MEEVLTGNLPKKAKNIPIDGLGHISLAVPDLLEAIKFYRENFGFVVSDPQDFAAQGIRMAYVELGNAKLELMEPLGSNSPISNFLERNPNGGLHHFCLTTENAFEAAAFATNSGMRVLGGETITTGHHGRKLFFIHPKDTLGSLIEIEESVSGTS